MDVTIQAGLAVIAANGRAARGPLMFVFGAIRCELPLARGRAVVIETGDGDSLSLRNAAHEVLKRARPLRPACVALAEMGFCSNRGSGVLLLCAVATGPKSLCSDASTLDSPRRSRLMLQCCSRLVDWLAAPGATQLGALRVRMTSGATWVFAGRHWTMSFLCPSGHWKHAIGSLASLVHGVRLRRCPIRQRGSAVAEAMCCPAQERRAQSAKRKMALQGMVRVGQAPSLRVAASAAGGGLQAVWLRLATHRLGVVRRHAT